MKYHTLFVTQTTEFRTKSSPNTHGRRTFSAMPLLLLEHAHRAFLRSRITVSFALEKYVPTNGAKASRRLCLGYMTEFLDGSVQITAKGVDAAIRIGKRNAASRVGAPREDDY